MTRKEKFNWNFQEIVKTFSNQPSFYSSKRIERALIFINAIVGLDIGIYYLMVNDKLDWTAVVAIYSAQMLYAGYQTTRIFADKKQENGTTTGKEGQPS